MCGIIAVVRRRTARTAPGRADILGLLGPVSELLAPDDIASLDVRLERAADALERVNAMLRGVPGVEALLQSPDLRAAITHDTDLIASAISALDARLDTEPVRELERI